MKKKLLLADDSITIQKVIAITFSSDDYQLTVVDNGVSALDKARAERPDLIMADVFMPGKNGYEVCAEVKGDPALQGVPVLLLTGTFEPFDEDKALQSGADKWIAKPFESQSLIDCVENLLATAPTAPAPVAPAVAAPRPMPGTPAPPQPVVPVSTAPASPVRPLPGAPVAPPATPPAGLVAASKPEATTPVEDDIWGGGDDLVEGFDELAVPDEFATAEEFAVSEESAVEEPLSEIGAEDDLWGSISFEEPVPSAPVSAVEPSVADSWEGLDQDFPAAANDTFESPGEIPLADASIWGDVEEDLTSPQPEATIPLASGGWDVEEEMMPLDEVEILEEVDLGVAVDTLPEVEAMAGASLELSDYDAMADEELLWDEPATAAVTPATASVAPFANVEPDTAPVQASEDVFMEDAFADSAGAPIAPRSAQVAVAAPTLSEEEISRIVERVSSEVVERLAGAILEKVAWEVVPDLAEALIKAELRKLKDEVEARR